MVSLGGNYHVLGLRSVQGQNCFFVVPCRALIGALLDNSLKEFARLDLFGLLLPLAAIHD